MGITTSDPGGARARVTTPSAPSRSRVGPLPVALVTLVVAGVVLLGDLVGLDRHLPFAVFAALRPPLAVLAAAVALVGLGIAGLRRRRAGAAHRLLAASGALLAVALVAGALLVPRIGADDAPADDPRGAGTELTVLETNVYEGAADPDALGAVIARERPDLVVLPEAGDGYRSRIAARAPGYRSWTTVPPGVADVRGVTVLASPRAGDVTARALGGPASPGGTRYPWAEVTGGILGPVRLAAVHLVAPVPQWIADWPGELASLQRWCAAPGPTLVVGDFNASADHSPFRTGTEGCDDAAAERGVGLVPTWRSSWPHPIGTQIDHALLHDGPRATEAHVIDVPGTDHRGLLVRLRL